MCSQPTGMSWRPRSISSTSSVPVLRGSENRDARLELVSSTRTVLGSVLENLGLGAPEEM